MSNISHIPSLLQAIGIMAGIFITISCCIVKFIGQCRVIFNLNVMAGFLTRLRRKRIWSEQENVVPVTHLPL
jgi:hypothetical protein